MLNSWSQSWIIHSDTLYSLGSDLSGGKSSFAGTYRYQSPFEQLGTGEKGSVKPDFQIIVWAAVTVICIGIPIHKTQVIWASPVTLTLTLTLTQFAKVIWEGDAHITRVFGGNTALILYLQVFCAAF